MKHTANPVDMQVNTEWLDCSTGVITAGIDQSGNGQLTRLYYESYGNPANDPGERDGDKSETRRMLTLRATDVIPFNADEHPTISFVDDDGTNFYLTQLDRIKEYPPLDNYNLELAFREADAINVLTIQNGDELVPIGVNVALAVPDHNGMSPQLAKSTE